MSHLQWFNEKAATWDNIATEQTRQRLYRIVQSLHISPGSRILDVATGTGILLPWLLAAAGPTGRVTAIDFAPRMIAEAQKKHPQGVQLLVADVHHLPFADRSFDEVICNSAFPHFTDQPRAMREMARVLVAGGRLTICHPAPRQELNEFHRRLGGVVGNDMLPDTAAMQEMARAAGLVQTTITDGPEIYLFTAFRPAPVP